MRRSTKKSSPHAGDGALTPLDPAAAPSGPGAAEGSVRSSRFSPAPLGNHAEAEVPAEAPFSPLELRDRVVIALLFKEIVTLPQVEQAWQAWKALQRRGKQEALWRLLTKDPDLDRERIFEEAAQVYAFRKTTLQKLSTLTFIQDIKDAFTRQEWAHLWALQLVPLALEEQAKGQEKRWVFATHDPIRSEVTQFLRKLRIHHFELCYAPEGTLQPFIDEVNRGKNEYLDRLQENAFTVDLGANHEDKPVVNEDVLEAEISRSSLINLFEATLVEAVRQGASDVHIFPNPLGKVELHFRIDGELYCWHVEERVHPEAFFAVVKDKAINVDRFERDTAQDGFLQRRIDHALIRFRVSILPLANANLEARSESIVIRVLDDRRAITDLQDVGFSPRSLSLFRYAIAQSNGLVILTGPTGSGKSTTLYAALRQVVSPSRNVLTIEDPVEYLIPGVRQIKISHRLLLQDALRSILRHDPDVVMVGEMRDRNTADLAIKLANTGHLTFSTLHTNDAPSIVSRLYKMGIEPFLIAHSVNLVVAQRLVRLLCSACKQEQRAPDAFLLERLGFTPQEREALTFFEPGASPSCKTCLGTGHIGRQAIMEVMPFTKGIRDIIIGGQNTIDDDGLRTQAVAEGMHTLQEAAQALVRSGDLSLMEMIRTTSSGF